MASSHTHDESTESYEFVEINGLTLNKTTVIDSPVFFNLHTMPSHTMLNCYTPQVHIACPTCMYTRARLQNLDEDSNLISTQSLPELSGCTCRNNKPVGISPYPLDSLLPNLTYKTSYASLPPAFPVTNLVQAPTIWAFPCFPTEFVPHKHSPYQWPKEHSGVSNNLLVARQYAIQLNKIIPSDTFFQLYHTFSTTAITYDHVNGTVEKISAHVPMSGPVQSVLPTLRTHTASLVRLFRDSIVKTDVEVERIRSHLPETWTRHTIFHCYTTHTFDAEFHQQLALTRNFLIQLPMLLSYLRKYPLPPQETLVLATFFDPAPILPGQPNNDVHRSMLWQVVHNAIQATQYLSCVAALCMRRYYLFSSCLYAYKFSINNNLLRHYQFFYDDLPPLGRMKDICPKPSFLRLQQRHFIPTPLNKIAQDLQTLLTMRQLWDFPNIPPIMFGANIKFFFPNLETSLDGWRKHKYSPHEVMDTCLPSCMYCCSCLDQSQEKLLERAKPAQHLPVEWPFLSLESSLQIIQDDSHIIQNISNFPLQSTNSFSNPGRVLLNPAPFLSEDSHNTTADTEEMEPQSIQPQNDIRPTNMTQTTTSTNQPANPPTQQPQPQDLSPNRSSTPRLRRTDGIGLENLFQLFLFFTLFAPIFSSSVIRKGNFVYETVSPHVMVSPNFKNFARKLDFETVHRSVDQLYDIHEKYTKICKFLLKSASMIPTYTLVEDETTTLDATKSCIQRNLLPPTVEHNGEKLELYNMMTQHNINLAASPYLGQGPGALSINTLVNDGSTLSPTFLPFTPDVFNTDMEMLFPSLFRRGGNNSLHLTYVDTSSSFSPPPLVKLPRALICRNRDAGFMAILRNNSATQPVLHALCNTQTQTFQREIAKIERLLHLIQPSHIASLETSYYSMDYKPPSFLTIPVASKTVSFSPYYAANDTTRQKREKPNSLPNLADSFWTFAQAHARKKRAVGAVLVAGAGIALLLAGVVMSSINTSKMGEVNQRLDSLASEVSNLKLFQTNMQEKLQEVAENLKNVAENLHHLDNYVSGSILLLQLKTDFFHIVNQVTAAFNTFLDITTFARRNQAHEALLSSDFLLDLQLRDKDYTLDLDPVNIVCDMVRNDKSYFIILRIPMISKEREGSLIKLHSLPFFQNNNKFYPITTQPYFIALKNENSFIPVESDQVAQCTKSPHNCRVTNPKIPAKLSKCGPSLFFNYGNNCSLTQAHDLDPKFLTFGNTTFFSVPSPTSLNIHCTFSRSPRPGAEETFIIKQVGSFTIEQDCMAKTLDGISVSSSNSQQKKLLVSDIFDIGPQIKRRPFSFNFTFPEFHATPYSNLIQDIATLGPKTIFAPSLKHFIHMALYISTFLAFTTTLIYYILLFRLRQYVKRQVRKICDCPSHHRTIHNIEAIPTPPPPTPPPPLALPRSLSSTLRELKTLQDSIEERERSTSLTEVPTVPPTPAPMTLTPPTSHKIRVQTMKPEPPKRHLATFKNEAPISNQVELFPPPHGVNT